MGYGQFFLTKILGITHLISFVLALREGLLAKLMILQSFPENIGKIAQVKKKL